MQRDNAVRERDRLLGLVARSLVSESEADRQSAAADAAEATLLEAEADLRELQEGTRAEQLAQARQAADSARAKLQGLETTSSRLEVRSPIAGTIDSLPFHLGEKPARGATVAVLLATTAPFARIHVPEPIRARVKVGTPATLPSTASHAPSRARCASSPAKRSSRLTTRSRPRTARACRSSPKW